MSRPSKLFSTIVHKPEPSIKIPKGFVLVNLSESEKAELRDLAREMNIELRHALRLALHDLRQQLEARVKIKRQTGLDWQEQYWLIERGASLN